MCSKVHCNGLAAANSGLRVARMLQEKVQLEARSSGQQFTVDGTVSLQELGFPASEWSERGSAPEGGLRGFLHT